MNDAASQPARDKKYRILAIHAHPDDLEFQCAGTLAHLAAAGHALAMVTMTAGDCGSKDLGPDEISAIRRQEAKRAADLLAAEYACLEFPDLSIVIDNDAKRRVSEAVRRFRPDLIITAPPVDYMDDHESTSRLVRDGAFNASCPNYATRQWEPAPPTDKIPHLYYVDPIDGIDPWGAAIKPHFYVDISDVFATKRAMLACHDSQRAWLRAQHGVDEYLDSQQRWSAKRGSEMGVAYAEAFRQHRGHPYPSDNLLAKLLGDLAREVG